MELRLLRCSLPGAHTAATRSFLSPLRKVRTHFRPCFTSYIFFRISYSTPLYSCSVVTDTHELTPYAERIKSNFKQIELSPDDYEKITLIGKNNHTRFNIPATYKPKWDINLFNEPAEQDATYQVKVE